MDSSGKIWISSFGGLTCYDKAKNIFTSFFHNDKDYTSISHNQIWKTCIDANNNLWLATSVGFDCFNTKTNKVIQHVADPSIVNLKTKQDNPLLVFKGLNKTVWLICQNTGVFCYDINKKIIIQDMTPYVRGIFCASTGGQHVGFPAQNP